MKIRRTALTVDICLALIATTAISTFAISSIIKEKNPYQIAAERNSSISEVDTGKNFKYTEFDSNEEIKSDNHISNEITDEPSNDPKIIIYKKMLNTIDYFNEVELTLETSMLGNEKAIIRYQTNIDEGYAYESVSENGILVSETYGDPNSVYLTFVDNKARTYNQHYLGSFKRLDTHYTPLANRIFTEEDGIPCYVYRKNVTNCPLASYSLVPQEMAFSYLKDFGNWEIVDDEVEYLGRICIKINGKTTPYVANKHCSDTFTMLVDSETGILMKFEGVRDGDITNYIMVTDCTFGKIKAAVKQFDANEYTSYTEVF